MTSTPAPGPPQRIPLSYFSYHVFVFILPPCPSPPSSPYFLFFMHSYLQTILLLIWFPNAPCVIILLMSCAPPFPAILIYSSDHVTTSFLKSALMYSSNLDSTLI